MLVIKIIQPYTERSKGSCVLAVKWKANQKISGWLAGRWRLHGGAAVDVALPRCAFDLCLAAGLRHRYKAAE
jgi:hypothetical protein